MSKKKITVDDELIGAFTEGRTNAEETMAVINAARKDPNIRKIIELSFDIDKDMAEKEAFEDKPVYAFTAAVRGKEDVEKLIDLQKSGDKKAFLEYAREHAETIHDEIDLALVYDKPAMSDRPSEEPVAENNKVAATFDWNYPYTEVEIFNKLTVGELRKEIERRGGEEKVGRGSRQFDSNTVRRVAHNTDMFEKDAVNILGEEFHWESSKEIKVPSGQGIFPMGKVDVRDGHLTIREPGEDTGFAYIPGEDGSGRYYNKAVLSINDLTSDQWANLINNILPKIKEEEVQLKKNTPELEEYEKTKMQPQHKGHILFMQFGEIPDIAAKENAGKDSLGQDHPDVYFETFQDDARRVADALVLKSPKYSESHDGHLVKVRIPHDEFKDSLSNLKQMGYKVDIVEYIKTEENKINNSEDMDKSKEEGEKKLYHYTMMHRGPGFGNNPTEGLVSATSIDRTDYDTGYGKLVYDRPLTNKEVSNFELRPDTYLNGLVGKSFVSKSFPDLVAKIIGYNNDSNADKPQEFKVIEASTSDNYKEVKAMAYGELLEELANYDKPEWRELTEAEEQKYSSYLTPNTHTASQTDKDKPSEKKFLDEKERKADKVEHPSVPKVESRWHKDGEVKAHEEQAPEYPGLFKEQAENSSREEVQKSDRQEEHHRGLHL